jgi:thioredoxin 1
MANIADVTDATFEARVLHAEVPVMVDCHASWCGPCKAMMPSIADLAREFEDEVEIFKLDVEANPQTRERYRIAGLPTFLLFKGGEVVNTVRGTTTRSRLAAELEKMLGDSL